MATHYLHTTFSSMQGNEMIWEHCRHSWPFFYCFQNTSKKYIVPLRINWLWPKYTDVEKKGKTEYFKIHLAFKLKGQCYAIYLLIIIWASLSMFLSSSNYLQSLNWLTLYGELQKRSYRGSSDFSFHHRGSSFYTWTGYVPCSDRKNLDCNLNIQKMAMLKFEICFSQLKACDYTNKLL